MFAILLFVTACGNHRKKNEQNSPNPVIAYPIDEAQDTEKEASYETTSSYEISNVNATVFYEGNDFKKSVFTVGGEMIYICGLKLDGKFFLGGMKKEENTLQEFPIEMPANMRVFEMAVDNQGRCHMLWMSIEKIIINDESLDQITFKKSYITIVNSNGDVENTIDVTDIFLQEQHRPYCFIVDQDGNYYFENKKEIVILNQDGSPNSRVTCNGYVEGIGCGKSGMVYGTYYDENNNDMIGRLENNAFVPCDVTLPNVNAIYANINAGTDTELLLYNLEGGIYTYASDKNVVEQRVQGKELPVSGQDVSSYGFLGDGRLCLMTQSDEETIFYYIPAGK